MGEPTLRRRHRRRGRRHRVRPCARGRARRAGRPAREVRHRGRDRGRRRRASTSRRRGPSSTTPRRALPRVERATLRQDLFRRDFTINAMAVSLKGEDFGASWTSSAAGATSRRESSACSTRSRSSTTRRASSAAIRYENRYGFRMDGHTAALARACVEMNLVGELSSARLRDELQALLVGGATSTRAVARLDGARRRRRRSIRTSPPTRTRSPDRRDSTSCATATRPRCPRGVPAWPSLARRLPPGELFDWFERLPPAPPRRRADRGRGHRRAAARAAPRGDRRAGRDPAPRRAARPRRRRSSRSRWPTSPPAARLERYFDELRGVRLEITGADLAGLGVGESPRVGEILDELLRRKLNGELDGRAEELDAARELARRRVSNDLETLPLPRADPHREPGAATSSRTRSSRRGSATRRRASRDA